MSTTLKQLANDALADIGVLLLGQTATDDLLAGVRRVANQMLDAMLIDELMVYSYPASIFTLQALLEQYQIGPGQVSPNFAAARPTGIQDANIILNTVNPVVRLPVNIISTVDEWANIRVRAATPGATAPISAIPTDLYYDNGFDPTTGYATINLWPAPIATYQLELFLPATMPFASFADLTTAYSFPPAYKRMIRRCLADELIPTMAAYIKVEADLDRVHRLAVEAKSAVMSANAPDAILTGDPAYGSGGRRAGWVYATGDYGRRR